MSRLKEQVKLETNSPLCLWVGFELPLCSRSLTCYTCCCLRRLSRNERPITRHAEIVSTEFLAERRLEFDSIMRLLRDFADPA